MLKSFTCLHFYSTCQKMSCLHKNLKKFHSKHFIKFDFLKSINSYFDKKTRNIHCSYSETVFSPKTQMPLRRSYDFELTLLEKSSFVNFYYDQRNRKNVKEFILHDGPPYANGSLHFGHVINKVLKDIICRYKMKQGYRVNFRPGWDCHGLPIEIKVFEQVLNQNFNAIDIRQKAKSFAESAIKIQCSSFKNLGVLANWKNPYFTFTPSYIIQELKAFFTLYEKKLLYRNYFPVYWSPSNVTTLAEAELEYNDNHKGHSLYFKFKLLPSVFSSLLQQDIYALIWTTTPWTLPANQAIAFSNSLNYNIVRANDGVHFIVARELIPDIQKNLNTMLVSKYSLEPKTLKSLSYFHPMKKKKVLPFLESSFVAKDKGTGLVHCAPNHGHDDFNLALKNNLVLESNYVDDLGRFVDGVDPLLDGKLVFEEGSFAVIEKLRQNVVCWSEYYHKYPYDWRSKKPVIITTSQQWFIDINLIRDECLKVLKSVKFYPLGVQEQIKNELSSRPPWCISRQRSWGVPIPVFYSSQDKHKKKPIFSKESIDHLIRLILKKGVDVWWSLSENELLPLNLKNNLGVQSTLIKSKDIFDVWVDSGLSWNHILKSKDETIDMYLEGLDQCRGWFQSSLILSVALRNKAPYNSVYVHGFAVDPEGKKMSKSLGNVINPLDLIKEYGVDVLRWYVAKYASSHSNVPIDKAKFKVCKQSVFKVRNTLRFCNGVLNDFMLNNRVEYQKLRAIDKYMFHLIFNYTKRCENYYETNQFKSLVIDTQNLIEKNISSFYFTAIKDRLYCDKINSESRRSCQTVIHQMVHVLNNFLSPILPFLFEDWYSFYPCDDKKSHFLEENWFECPYIWFNNDIERVFNIIKSIKKSIDIVRDKNKLQLKQFYGYLQCSKSEDLNLLKNYTSASDLVESIMLSKVEFVPDIFSLYDKNKEHVLLSSSQDSQFMILLQKSDKFCCPRCRLYHSVKNNHLCERCSLVLGQAT